MPLHERPWKVNRNKPLAEYEPSGDSIPTLTTLLTIPVLGISAKPLAFEAKILDPGRQHVLLFRIFDMALKAILDVAVLLQPYAEGLPLPPLPLATSHTFLVSGGVCRRRRNSRYYSASASFKPPPRRSIGEKSGPPPRTED